MCNDVKATVCCAVYAETGQMLDLDFLPITAEQESYLFSLDVDSGDVVKVFLLDAGLHPLCASVQG